MGTKLHRRLRLCAVVAALALVSSAYAGPGAKGSAQRQAGPTTEHRLLRGMRRGARARPDTLFSRGSRMVVDASSIRSTEFKGLQLVPLQEIFANPKATFIGFGAPNTYIAVPRKKGDAKGAGWNKFAAFMFWRRPSYVADTKGRVQGGLLVEMRGLPARARAALRTAMEAESGRCHASCANANARVLEAAGFELQGPTRLSEILLPSRLAREIWEHGLRYRGKPVHLRFIATYEGTTQDHFGTVIKKQLTAPVRAVKKALATNGSEKAPVIDARDLGPAVVRVAGTSPRAELRMGRPGKWGAALSTVWGEHPLYSAVPANDNATIDSPEFWELHAPLPPFPGERSRLDRIKVKALGGAFGRAVRRLLAKPIRQAGGGLVEMDSLGSVAGETLVKMLRVGERDRPFLYNLVVTGSDIRVARLENRSAKDNKAVNWLLAKHLLISGNSSDVRFAGELWVEESPAGRVVHINNNSGTYKPSVSRAVAMARYLETALGTKVEAHDTDGAVLSRGLSPR